MKLLGIVLVGLVGTSFFFNGCSSQTVNVKLKTELDTMSYALGINLSEQFKQGEIEDLNVYAFAKGMRDGMEDKGEMTTDEAMAFLNTYFTELQEKKAAIAIEEGQKFLDENAKQAGVVVDESGLQYKVLVEGTGAKPTPEDVVRVHYHGTLMDGTVFDSSVERGEPAQFQLNRVIQGWQIGLQKMAVGSKYMLYIPSELGYGANPRPGGPIKPNAVLIFEVELLEIVKE